MARNILSIAVPMTVAQVVNILYSLVDRMYIGHIPGVGHTSLTGMGLTLPLISIVLAFANLGGMGGSPLCSIYRGKGEEEEAERIMAKGRRAWPAPSWATPCPCCCSLGLPSLW